MAKVRAEKSLADYVAIAFSPVLIMALAGSLAFFLLELAYTGGYPERIRWILFWFVFASVLVGRIAIEQGSEHAQLFGVALAGVTALATYRLAPDAAVAGLFVLAVIWWSVHRLTFDCTLIDDSQDSSGEGLLQSSGLEADKDGRRKKRSAWWTAIFGAAQGSRAPGTWVVYFSLAALPLFGIGQVFIPAAAVHRRQFAFLMLLIYVASALGLLLTTSFLGLRRYLRQRRLKMPAAMAGIWLGAGLALIAVILGIGYALPRPDHSSTAGEFWGEMAQAVQPASDQAMMGNEGGQGPGRELAQNAPQQPPDENRPDQGPEGEPAPAGQPPDPRRPQPEGNEPANPAQQNGPAQADKAPDQAPAGKPQGDGQPHGEAQPGDDKRQNENLQAGRAKAPEQPKPAEPRPGEQQSGKQQPADGHPSEPAPKGGRAEQNPAPNQPQPNQPQPNADPNQPQPDQPQKNQPHRPEPQVAREDRDQPANPENAREPGEPNPEQPANGEPANQPAANEQPPEPPETPEQPAAQAIDPGEWFSWMSDHWQIVAWLILGTLGGIFVIRNWAACTEFVNRLWQAVLSLFGSGTRASSPAEAAVAAVEESPPLRPFSEMHNPFSTGDDSRMKPAELLRTTFDALQAWGIESGCPRRRDQTPLEFVQRLTRQAPRLGGDPQELAQLYSRLVYAGQPPGRESLPLMQRLWRQMETSVPIARD